MALAVGLSAVLAATSVRGGEPQTSVRADARAREPVRDSGGGDGGAAVVGVPFAMLPEPIASFGAAVCGDWLYVYGGHTGKKHVHTVENVTGAFWRLNLLDGRTWESLPAGTPLQSVALVCHDRKLYRVGGMTSVNQPGEPEDMHSVAEFARYEPLSRTWHALPSLPKGRSSHDAVVLDGRVYVAGGWRLAGASDDATWIRTAYVFDLNAEDAAWRELSPQPFARRALALAAAGERVYAIGGLTDEDGPVRRVDIYDPQTDAWSTGPELPDYGFGVSAIGDGDSVFVSGREGAVFRLGADAEQWRRVGRWTFGRIFHRMLAWGGELLALGGADRGGHIRQIERLSPGSGEPTPRVVHWAVPYPGRAKNRAALFLHERSLYLFGGNNGLGQHDFARENFLREGFRIHLGSLRIEPLAEFPVPRQSMQTVVPSGEEHTGYAVAGFGHDGSQAVTQGDVYAYHFKADRWTKAGVRLPGSRTQFGLVEWDGALWVFGGLQFDGTKTAEDRFDHRTEVLEWRSGSEAPTFTPTAYELPRPRRAFGGALLKDRYYLVGGMRENFELVEPCDVFNFSRRAWETIPAPGRPRISPELVALQGKLYLAGGSSRNSAGDIETNQSVEVFDPETREWSLLLEKLPISARHMRMLPFGDALLMVSTYDTDTSAAALVLVYP